MVRRSACDNKSWRYCVVAYVISDLNEEITGTCYKKEVQKTNQNGFRVKKVVKRKGNKLFVKWKGYDNSFNSRIYKKEIV